MSLGRYIARKLVEMVPALILVSLLVFTLVHLTPGDPITTMLGPYASQQLIDATRAQYDLDKPLPAQYARWLGKVVRGDLGKSIQSREPVAKMIVDRLPVTVSLALWATLFSCLISVPAGVAAAVHAGRPLDTATIGATALFLSIPDFVAATALVLVGGVTLRILPMVGYVSLFADPVEFVRHMVMPATALGLIYLGLLSRMVRSSMLDVLGTEYIRTARAKGLGEKVVVLTHGLRNALIPSVALVSLNFANMLGGTIVIEEIFALPGLGRLIVRGVLARDFPVIQGATLFVGFGFILSSLVTDVFLAIIDPRIRHR
jgi:peptide/nickel transport system permease protein